MVEMVGCFKNKLKSEGECVCCLWVGLVLHYRRALSLTYNASLFVYYTRLIYRPMGVTKQLSQIKYIHEFSSLVFQMLPDAKCNKNQKLFSYFRLGCLICIYKYTGCTIWKWWILKSYHFHLFHIGNPDHGIKYKKE